jgi:electron transfer flavoprotein beta subunit
VITGTESTDGYTGTVPEQVAELLGMPSVTFVSKVEVSGGKLVARRQTEAGYDEVECPLPAVVSVTGGVVEPRYPSFKGIMAAKSKPVEQLGVADLGLDPTELDPRQEILEVRPAEERGAGEIVHDEGAAHLKVIEFLEKLKVV